MAEDRKINAKHSVLMENRERLTISGVVDVLSFDEETIVSDTEQGVIVIHGVDLHVTRLNVETGDLYIDGEIDSIEYQREDAFSKNKGSILSRIFK